MRIVVVGAGPIGGNIGGRLARQDKDITFINVDPDHVQAIRKDGLHVDVPDGNFNIPVRILFPNEIDGKFDIAFIAVRTNYTGNAVNSIVPYLAENGLLGRRQARPGNGNDSGQQRPATGRSEHQCRTGEQARDCLLGGQWSTR